MSQNGTIRQQIKIEDIHIDHFPARIFEVLSENGIEDELEVIKIWKMSWVGFLTFPVTK